MAGRRAGFGITLLAALACAVAAHPARADETYAIFDAVFLQRDIGAAQRPLVTETTSGAPAIRTDDLTFATQPGMRLFYGRKGDCAPGWEVGYLGVWGMFGEDANVSAVNTLQAANPLGAPVGSLNGAGVARATYRSSLNSAEANIFSRWCDGGYDRSAGEPWRRCDNYHGGNVDWLAGFRWASLDEQAALAFAPAPNLGSGLYAVESSSNIFAAQVGARARAAWDRWAFESWAKLALGGTAMSQSQAPIVNSIINVGGQPVIERPALSAAEGGVGFIGDMNFTLTYRLTETWGLRMGYNLIWLSGVALAPNQFDFSSPPGGGGELHGGSSVFLSGASLGLEARW